MTQKVEHSNNNDKPSIDLPRERETKANNRPQQTELNEQQMIEQLIEIEEQIAATDKDISRNKKAIKQLKQSNTWVYSKPLRKTTHFLKKMTSREQAIEQKQLIAELEAKLAEKNSELFSMKQQLVENKMENLPLHDDEITRLIRDLRDRGELIKFLNHAVQKKSQLQKNYATALKYIARLYMNKNKEYRDWIYDRVFSALMNEEVPEFMVRPSVEGEPLSLQHVASFRGSLNMRMRKKQLQEQPLPEWLLDDKQDAYSFIEKLGIRIPWVSEETYSLETLPIKEGVVIKPADGAGSRGVYLVNTVNDIIDLKRSEQLHSWGELLKQMQKDLTTNWVEKDDWLMEELILENREDRIPARDVKFYSFYGKVGIILEITRYPEAKYCWWTASGKRIHVGKYGEEVFKGKGVSQEELAMVEKLSEKIPTPFIRIDFLRAEDGLVFGEFTPKPGNYDEFDSIIDQKLGDYFLEAENRLTNDLMAGKTFEEFAEFRKQLVMNQQ